MRFLQTPPVPRIRQPSGALIGMRAGPIRAQGINPDREAGFLPSPHPASRAGSVAARLDHSGKNAPQFVLLARVSAFGTAVVSTPKSERRLSADWLETQREVRISASWLSPSRFGIRSSIEMLIQGQPSPPEVETARCRNVNNCATRSRLSPRLRCVFAAIC